MNVCRKCGKKIPEDMHEAYDEKHNFQPYYTSTCPECYDEDFDEEETPIFIGITETRNKSKIISKIVPAEEKITSFTSDNWKGIDDE